MSNSIVHFNSACFLNSWVFPYEIHDYILTDKGPSLLSFYFYTCVPSLVLSAFQQAHHRQPKRQTARYNKSIAAPSRHQVPYHQSACDIYGKKLKYSNNTQVHKMTRTSPFPFTLRDTHAVPASNRYRPPTQLTSLVLRLHANFEFEYLAAFETC